MTVTTQTYSVDEGARILGISKATLQRHIYAGQVPAIRLGRRLLIPRAYLDGLFAVSIRTLSDEVDRIPDLLREIDEWRDRELHLSQMLSIEKDEIATLTARVAELEAALRTSEHRRDIERECRAPVCELEAENEALRKRVAETNDAIMRLVPMHTPGGTVAEKIAAYIEQLKRDRDSAIDRKWLDDAAREKCRVLQLAAKHSRRVAELEAQVQECHEWADTNQCWQDIAEIFGPRKGAPQ